MVLVVQVPFAQQPVQPVAALHWHEPPTHCVPGPHTAPPPQVHMPPLQVSPPAAAQSKHAVPPDPQLFRSNPPVMHWPFRQQPFGQFAVVQPEHMPPAVQVWPAGQVWQIEATPHAAAVVPVSQLPASAEQQPWQVATSQTHWPLLHLKPAPHEGPVPQRQSPPTH